jgi:hypothetical protein
LLCRTGFASFNARLEWDRDQQICVEQGRTGQAEFLPLLPSEAIKQKSPESSSITPFVLTQ